MPPALVVFACRHNAGRSQMAAAFFNRLADPRRATAISAGTEPASRVHPQVVTVMREIGVDLGAAIPRPLTAAVAASASWLVTMGCGEACPVVPNVRRAEWPVDDPKDAPLDRVRGIRNEIRDRVERFISDQAFAR